MSDLWTHKYRPKSLDEYVWRDASHRQMVEAWLKEGTLPHILLGGPAGCGKSSCLLMMLDLLNVNKGDILFVNASHIRKIDDVEIILKNFVRTWPIGKFKYILLDEADRMTPHSQDFLKAFIEQYQDTCRFLFTSNHANKIIPPIHSRCQTIIFDGLDQDQYLAKALTIMAEEGFDIENEDNFKKIEAITNIAYPDLRKCINLLQQNSKDGVINIPSVDAGSFEYLTEAAAMVISGKYIDARKHIIANINDNEYEEAYRFFYKNLELWGESEAQQNQALIVIKQGLVDNTLVADKEINLAATLVMLCEIAKG